MVLFERYPANLFSLKMCWQTFTFFVCTKIWQTMALPSNNFISWHGSCSWTWVSLHVSHVLVGSWTTFFFYTLGEMCVYVLILLRWLIENWFDYWSTISQVPCLMQTTKPTKHILWAVSSTTFLLYFLAHLHFNHNKLFFFQALFVTRKVAETQIIECSDLSYKFALYVTLLR